MVLCVANHAKAQVPKEVTNPTYVDFRNISDSSLIARPDSTLSAVDTSFSDNQDFAEEINYASADSMFLDVVTNEVHLFGNAEVSYQDINLKACYIIVNATKKTVRAIACTDSITQKPIGLPTFTSGADVFTSKKISYNFETKKARVSDVVTQQGEGFLIAQDVKMINDSTFFIKDAFYTTCSETDHPHFGLNITKGKVIKNRTIISGPAYLELAGIPLPVALPFAYYPITEKHPSGLVLPNYGKDVRGFFLIGGGYYFAINQRLALNLGLDITSKGSWAVNPRITYRKRYKYSGNIGFKYSSLRTGVNIGELGYKPRRDFNIVWSHSQDARTLRNASFSANVNAGTSTFLKNTSFTNTQYTQNQLNSSVAFAKSFKDIKFPFQVQGSLGHNQNTQTKSIDLKLPNITVSGLSIMPFQNNKGGKQRFHQTITIAYNFGLQNVLSTYDSLFKSVVTNPNNLAKRLNFGINHSVTVSSGAISLFKSINISPSASYTERWYIRKLEKRYDPIKKKIVNDTIADGLNRVYNYGVSVSATTALYGMYQIKSKRIALKTIRHTMRPSISFGYAPNFADKYAYKIQTDTIGKRFGYVTDFDEGIYGTAPIGGKSGSIGFNLDNNVEGKFLRKTDTSSTLEKKRLIDGLQLNTSYNLAADSLNLANINLSGRVSLGKSGAGTNFGANFSPYEVDSSGNSINTYLWQSQRKPAVLNSAFLSFNYSLNSQSLAGGNGANTAQNANPQPVGFDVPFDFAFFYTFRYQLQRAYFSPKQKKPKPISQSFTINGSTRLTENWRIGFITGYDISTRQVSATSINIDRNLHCWRLSVQVNPFGAYKSYMFTLQPVSGMLSSLKLTRRREWFTY